MEYVIAKTLNYKRDNYGRAIALGGEPHVDKKNREVTGIAAVFGNVDAGQDVVLPGAFKRSIDEFKAGRSRARFLWNHKSGDPPIAKILSLRELSKSDLPKEYMTANNVVGGLEVVRKYFADDFSERVFQGVVSGSIAEMSFAYDVVDQDFADLDGKQVRLLKELELFDVSDVNWGMNSQTVAAMRKMRKGPLVTNAATMQADRKDSDELMVLKERAARLRYSLKNPNSPYVNKSSPKLQIAMLRAWAASNGIK